MKQFFIAIVILILIIMSSCIYKANDIFERELNQNLSAPDIETVELDLSQSEDTVILIYKRVYFNFKSSNQEIIWVKFYINDSMVGKVNAGNSYYDFRYTFLENGYYKLRLEVFTHSGTGSIADSLDVEGFLFSTKQWMIKVIDTDINTLTSSVSEGFLKLRWLKPYNYNPEFIIYRSDFEIGRTTSCEFIDKGYVGEGGEFKVYVTDGNQPERLNLYGSVEIPKEMNLTFIYDTDNNYTINWGKLKYYAAVDSIILMSYSDFDPIHRDKTTDISKTGFEVPTNLFGQNRQYHLALTPKYPNPIYDPLDSYYSLFISPRFDFMIGAPSPIYNSFFRVNSNEFVYHTDKYDHSGYVYNDSMFRYSVVENRILDRFSYNLPKYSISGSHYFKPSISPDGNNLIALAGMSQYVIYGSTYDFSNYKILYLSNLTNTYPNIKISNKGTGIIPSGNENHVYDFNNNVLLGTIDYNSASIENISADGEYVFFNKWHSIDLFHFSNGSAYLIKTLNQEPPGNGFDYFEFLANDPDKVISWSSDSKVLNIMSNPDMSVLKSFHVNEERLLDIDYNTNRILSSSANLLVVRSLIDGSILYMIPVGLNGAYTQGCYLSGNNIFYKEGVRYFLN